MKKILLILAVALSACACGGEKHIRNANYASQKRFKALLLWEPHAERDHVDFDKQAMEFFRRLNWGQGFQLDSTTSLDGIPLDSLRQYSIIVALNAAPSSPQSRANFEKYMEEGGGWMGFHASAYNDRRTNWPWYVQFLGGGVFKCNNWPPQPALAVLDETRHPVTKALPKEFVLPASEFYQWSPEPRANKDIQVLLSLSPKNYPIGIKDIVYGGDWPIVWTNRNYRMIYLNMGHGNQEFKDANQDLLFVSAFRWIVSRDPSGNPFDK